jgi:hypothetical protein
MKGRITKGSEEAPHVPEKRERGGQTKGERSSRQLTVSRKIQEISNSSVKSRV